MFLGFRPDPLPFWSIAIARFFEIPIRKKSFFLLGGLTNWIEMNVERAS